MNDILNDILFTNIGQKQIKKSYRIKITSFWDNEIHCKDQ